MPSSSRKYYLMLFAVVLCWGIDPVISSYLFNYYSAAVFATLATFVSAIFFLIYMRKDLKKLSGPYLRIALPICLVNSVACILQRIGLQYTTPARYAFFEHLSCVVVPLILFLCFKKRPSAQQCAAAVLCLGGCLLLAGADVVSGSFDIGDVLCILAGILLGVGIIATSRYTQGMDIKLFMVVHMCTYFVTSLSLMLALHFISVNGAPMERILFTPSPLLLLAAAIFGLLSVGLCWLMRNEATRHLNPSSVAVIAPISAVITAFISILLRIEVATPPTLIAFALILSAALLSGLSERPSSNPQEATQKKSNTALNQSEGTAKSTTEP